MNVVSRLKRWWWLPLVAVLSGCEPVRVDIYVNSPGRIEATITATVDTGDRELALATVDRLAPGKWRVDETLQKDKVRLVWHRRLDPSTDPDVQVTRKLRGPLWLRYAYEFKGSVELPALPPEHMLSSVLADKTAYVAVHLPGGGSKTPVALRDALGAKVPIAATGVIWNRWLLLLYLVILGSVAWVTKPWWLPPPEVRQKRAAERAERRAQAAEKAKVKAERKAEADARKAEADALKAERAAAAKAAADAKAAAAAEAAPSESAEPAAEATKPARRGLFARKREPQEPKPERTGRRGRRSKGAADEATAPPAEALEAEPEAVETVSPEPAMPEPEATDATALEAPIQDTDTDTAADESATDSSGHTFGFLKRAGDEPATGEPAP